MMLRCVRDGPAAVDWAAALKLDEMSVLSSGKILAGRSAQPGCAIAVFRTIANADSVTLSARWAAFLGLQTQLAAVRRGSEAAKEFARREVVNLPLGLVYLLVASAGGGFESEASAVADSSAAKYDQSSVQKLWYLGTWEAHRKNVPRVRQIVQALTIKSDSSGLRRDRLVRDAITARLTLLEGDSATALRMFLSLSPSATRQQLAWNPLESLGPERIELAKLLFARGRLEEAFGVATQLDATEPLTYPLYLRESLTLRLRIAEAMKNARLSADLRRRITALNWSG